MHREPAAAGAGDPAGDRHHPQHRQLRGADLGAVRAAGAAVQHQHRGVGAPRRTGVDQTPQGTSTVNATMFVSAFAVPALNE